jgi:hypothetical protein
MWWCTERISKRPPSRCLRVKAFEPLYRSVLVQSSREKGRRGERNSLGALPEVQRCLQNNANQAAKRAHYRPTEKAIFGSVAEGVELGSNILPVAHRSLG